jgi:uncharacterized membrane protein YraQ (UPF0718 family)
MIIRPVAAILSAVTTGLLAESLSGRESEPADSASSDSGTTRCTTSYCGAKATGAAVQAGRLRSLVAGLRHAVFDLLDDIAGWLLIGILLAAALETFVPANAMTQWGSGLLPMLAILLISIPMYICATASTPVAASMLLAGISPGTVLVFLLAGPATNLASAGLLRRELGLRATLAYLVGMAVTSVGLGLLVDVLLAAIKFSPASQIDMTAELVPPSVCLVTAVLLGLLAVKPVRRIAGRIWKVPFARQSTRNGLS